MEIEIKIPNVGESVQEAVLVEWYKSDDDFIQKDEPLFVVETDKVTLEIVAEMTGVLKILVSEGETVAIGTTVGTIAVADVSEPPEAVEPIEEEREPEVTMPPTPDIPPPEPAEPIMPDIRQILPPSVRRLVAEKNLDVVSITGTGPGNRITKGDVLLYLEQVRAPAPVENKVPSPIRKTQISTPEISPKPVVSKIEDVTRKPMSPIRKRIATRLLEAKKNTAMLTTFNEIDMSRTMAIRSQFKEAFKEKFGVSLGFMSFFIKASVEALKEFPEINAYIDGKDIVYHNYYHIGVAIGTERGLVVPVIRNAELKADLPLKEIEPILPWKHIGETADQIRSILKQGGRVTIDNATLPDIDFADHPDNLHSTILFEMCLSLRTISFLKFPDYYWSS